jgi:hypothetical protein
VEKIYCIFTCFLPLCKLAILSAPTWSCVNPACLHIDIPRHSVARSLIVSLHIDVTLYSSLHHRITWFSVARILAKTGVRHRDTLVLLSDEPIMKILKRRHQRDVCSQDTRQYTPSSRSFLKKLSRPFCWSAGSRPSNTDEARRTCRPRAGYTTCHRTMKKINLKKRYINEYSCHGRAHQRVLVGGIRSNQNQNQNHTRHYYEQQ